MPQLMNVTNKLRSFKSGTVFVQTSFCSCLSKSRHVISKHLQIHKNNPEITWKNCKIPLAKASVNCAIATEVFEHYHNPGAVMSEFYR